MGMIFIYKDILTGSILKTDGYVDPKFHTLFAQIDNNPEINISESTLHKRYVLVDAYEAKDVETGR